MCVNDKLSIEIISVISIFNKPRNYPRVYEPYYDVFNFYEGRERWEESIKDIPLKAIHLFSIHWLHLEVYNGGFWQYFYNSTSTSYPEAVEGFKAIGMPEVATIVEAAAERLGSPFPFDKKTREEIVGPPDNRMNFNELDDRFYELADTEKFFRREPKFVPFAEKYAGNA